MPTTQINGLSAFTGEQLISHANRVYEEVLPPLNSDKVMTPTGSEHKFMAQIEKLVSQHVGQADWVSDDGRDIPRANSVTIRDLYNNALFGCSYGFNYSEQGAAQKVGLGLLDRRARACRRAMESFRNEVFFVGSTAKQIYGVSNNPYVPRITIDATDFQAGADPDNTLAALHGMENQVDEQSNQAFQPDVLAMPQTYYNFIATARASTLNSETILTVFLRNAQWIKSVISIREFNTAGPAGLPIMVALSTQSPDFIENIVPEELEILAPLRTSPLETTVSMVGETAGMITEYPIGHLIGEFDE